MEGLLGFAVGFITGWFLRSRPQLVAGIKIFAANLWLKIKAKVSKP